LTEFTSVMASRAAISRTTVRAWSKLPLIWITLAPWMRAWASFPKAMWPSGMSTAQRRPARAAYAAADADVLPVEAQMTAFDPSSTALDMATVMPRSLNDPVGFRPSYFRRTVASTRSER
jgi:hypothetical protein